MSIYSGGSPDKSSRRVILAFGSSENLFHMAKPTVKAISSKRICVKIAGSNGSVSVQLSSCASSGRFSGKMLLSGLKFMVVDELFFFIFENPFFIKQWNGLIVLI